MWAHIMATSASSTRNQMHNYRTVPTKKKNYRAVPRLLPHATPRPDAASACFPHACTATPGLRPSASPLPPLLLPQPDPHRRLPFNRFPRRQSSSLSFRSWLPEVDLQRRARHMWSSTHICTPAAYMVSSFWSPAVA